MIRRPPSLASGVLIALSALAVSAAVPAAVAQSEPAPGGLGPVAATVVHGVCHGGGAIVFEARRQGTKFVMTATTRGLPEGTRWRGVLDEESAEQPGVDRRVKVQAVVRDGGWSVTGTVAAIDRPMFGVTVFGPGKADPAGRFCAVLAQPAVPFAGVTFCRQSIQIVMTAVFHRSVGLVVRWGLIGARPGTVWTVTLEATTNDHATGVGSRRVAPPGTIILGKDVFTDEVNPRLRLSVEAKGGQRCTLSMHRVLARPAPPPQSLHESRGGVVTGRTEGGRVRSLLSTQQRLVGLSR